jgi:predicted MFS family arabinose efflux permease
VALRRRDGVDVAQWRIASVLTVAMAAGTLMQFTIGALGPQLTSYWGFNRLALGALSAVYYLVAALFSPLAGRFTARVGAYPAIVVLFVLIALAQLVAAGSPVYAVLLVGVGAAGLSAALCNPATNSALTGVRRARGALVGIKQSGAQLGGLLAGAVLPTLGLALGWRGAVLCALLVPAVGLLALPGRYAYRELRFTVRERARRARAARDKVPATVLWWTGYAACMGAGMSTITTYLPLYSSQALHFSVTIAGILLALVSAAGVLARIGWSVLVDSSRSPGPSVVLVGMALAAAAAIVVLNLALLMPTLAWVASAALGLTAAGWNGIVMLTVIRTLPPALVGRASGIIQAGFFLGLGIAPTIFGVLVDTTGHYFAGWSLSGLTFLAAMAIGLERGSREKRTKS